MRSSTRPRNKRRPDGLTLLEVLVTLAVLLIILVAVVEFMTDIDQAWKSAAADPFAEAADAFETVSQSLAAATIESYPDYADSSGSFCTNGAFVPDHLARRSDLDFVCGPSAGATGLLAASNLTTVGSGVFFLAPNGYTQTNANSGLGWLLNAIGYFVEFSDDTNAPGFMLPQAHCWRWRLKQVLQPAESLQIFSLSSSAAWTSEAWLQQLIPPGTSVPILAENVITLIVLPERAADDTGPALSPSFSYDSRDTTNPVTLHQLPPRLRLVLVAMDQASAIRLAGQDGSNPPQLVPATLFQQATHLDADVATLDSKLTAEGINHRIFERTILLPASNWSNSPAP